MALERVGVKAVIDGLGPYLAGTRQMESATTRLGRSLVTGASRLVKFAAIAGGAAIVGGAIASVKAFASFDAAMTKSLAIMGDVSEAMRTEMADAAREVAKQTTFSAEQAAESYFFLASAGLDAKQSVAALPLVAKFAQAGMFDMATATDLLTDAQSALGLTIRDDVVKNMENMTRISDVLAKANILSNATIEQFSLSLTREAGPAMKYLNIDVEEGVAVLAAFADQGIKGEIAGTAFSRILRLMTSAADNNAEAYERLNIKVFDAQGNIRNLADIIEDLENTLGGMSDQQKVAALEMLGFQARVQGVILPLLGTSDAIRNYEKQLRDAAGTTEEIAENQLKTFSAQLSLLQSVVNDVLIEIGQELTPVLESFVRWLRDEGVPALKQWWQEHLPELKAVAASTADVLRDLRDATIQFGSWIIDNQGRLVLAIGAIATAFFLLNPVIALIVGAGGLIVALGLFRTEIDKLPLSVQKMRLQVEAEFLKVEIAIVEASRTLENFVTLGGAKLRDFLAAKGIGTPSELTQRVTELYDELGWLELQIGDLDEKMAAFSAAPMIGEFDSAIERAMALGATLEQLQAIAFRTQGIQIAPPFPTERLPKDIAAMLGFKGADLARAGTATGEEWAKHLLDGLEDGLEDGLGDGAGGAGGAAEGLGEALGDALTEGFNRSLVDIFDELTASVDTYTSALQRLLGLPTKESAEADLYLAHLRLKAFDLEAKAEEAKLEREKKIAAIQDRLNEIQGKGNIALEKKLERQKEELEDEKTPAERELEATEDLIEQIEKTTARRQLELRILEAQARFQDKSLLTEYGREALIRRILEQLPDITEETIDTTAETLTWLGVAEDISGTYARILIQLQDIAAWEATIGQGVPRELPTGPTESGWAFIGGRWVLAPSMQQGGMVPGPVGEPQMVLAHGGELIVPPSRFAFNMPLTLNMPQNADWTMMRRAAHVELDAALDRARTDAFKGGNALGSGIG